MHEPNPISVAAKESGEPTFREIGVGPWSQTHPGQPRPDDPQSPNFDSRMDSELLDNGDRRNVLDRYRYWSVDAIKADLDARGRHGFEVAVENWTHDFNIGSMVRTANAFSARCVHIVGPHKWNRKGALMTELYQHVENHPSIEELITSWRAGIANEIADLEAQQSGTKQIFGIEQKSGIEQESCIVQESGIKQKSGTVQKSGNTQKPGINQKSDAAQESGIASKPDIKPDIEQESGVRQESGTAQRSGIEQKSDIEQKSGVTQESDTAQRSGIEQVSGVRQKSGTTQKADIVQESGIVQEHDVTQESNDAREHDITAEESSTSIEEQLRVLREAKVIALDIIPGAVPIETYHFPERCLMLFGAEGPGLSEKAVSMADDVVYISQFGSVRSINAGAAAAVAMHCWISQHAVSAV